jgi:hypothetical protein
LSKKPKELKDMQPSCSTCKFWREFTETGDEERYGTCHRYPPIMLHDEECPYPSWTVVAADEWCGELVSVN